MGQHVYAPAHNTAKLGFAYSQLAVFYGARPVSVRFKVTPSSG